MKHEKRIEQQQLLRWQQHAQKSTRIACPVEKLKICEFDAEVRVQQQVRLTTEHGISSSQQEFQIPCGKDLCPQFKRDFRPPARQDFVPDLTGLMCSTLCGHAWSTVFFNVQIHFVR